MNLSSFAVRYRNGPSLRQALGSGAACPRDRVCAGRRVAVWSSSATLLLGGVNFSGRRGSGRSTESPFGVSVVDPTTWSARPLDGSATDMAVIGGGTVLTFGGRRRGVRASAIGGSRRWNALGAERIRTATASGTYVYALSEDLGAYVIDAATGSVVSVPSTPLGRLEVLSERTNSGDAPNSS